MLIFKCLFRAPAFLSHSSPIPLGRRSLLELIYHWFFIIATTIFPLSCRISVPVFPAKENFVKVQSGCSAQELILMSFDSALCTLSVQSVHVDPPDIPPSSPLWFTAVTSACFCICERDLTNVTADIIRYEFLLSVLFSA